MNAGLKIHCETCNIRLTDEKHLNLYRINYTKHNIVFTGA